MACLTTAMLIASINIKVRIKMLRAECSYQKAEELGRIIKVNAFVMKIPSFSF